MNSGASISGSTSMSKAARIIKLAAVAVLGATLAGCGGGVLPDNHTITAEFDNANGLYAGNPVTVLGMRVGKITAMRPRGTGVEIRMSVDRSVPLPADVQAVTISNSVLTDRHIDLSPPYRGGPTLPDHAVLDRDHTKVPVEFDALLSMADKLSTSLAGDSRGHGPVADLLDVGAAATAGNGTAMRDALSQLSQALRVGDDSTATRNAITTVVNNLNDLTAAASRNDGTLRDFGSGVRQLSDLLAQENLGTGDTGARLRSILAQATDLLQKNQQNITALTGNADTITKSMTDYNDSLAETLDVFPLAADNVYNAVDFGTGALRATVDLNRMLLDGQMVKEVCNLLGLKNLGCATGTMRDMSPDFGLTEMLAAMAGVQPK